MDRVELGAWSVILRADAIVYDKLLLPAFVTRVILINKCMLFHAIADDIVVCLFERPGAIERRASGQLSGSSFSRREQRVWVAARSPHCNLGGPDAER
jgi:hypothetical protein